MRRFGLVGKSLKHSFSERYFSEKFLNEGLSNLCSYSLFELGDISRIRKLFAQIPNLEGVNVTIPYKENLIAHLDELSPSAAAIQAVNCIKLIDGKLIGYNTDIEGFSTSLNGLLNGIHITQALILGSGGASKAVQYVLEKLGVSFRIVSRSHGNVADCSKIAYSELTSTAIESSQLIVNTTPLGTFPEINECPDIPYNLLSPNHFLFDLVYNPPLTKFMAKGTKRGATCCNGYSMLVEQAEASWRIWNSKE